MSTAQKIIEHIVLFKLKPNTDPSRVTAMVNRLNALASLDQVLHLTAGPLLRSRSPTFNFTHILHSRYRTKDDLTTYSAHPSHVIAVGDYVRPICDDIMAVDWVVGDLSGPVVPRPGSAIRVKLLKLKEGLGEKGREEVLGGIGGGIRDSLGSIDQISFGENFSPARSKGFSIGWIGVFQGLKELDGDDQSEMVSTCRKEKLSREGLVESMIAVDFVIPFQQSASSL